MLFEKRKRPKKTSSSKKKKKIGFGLIRTDTYENVDVTTSKYYDLEVR